MRPHRKSSLQSAASTLPSSGAAPPEAEAEEAALAAAGFGAAAFAFSLPAAAGAGAAEGLEAVAAEAEDNAAPFDHDISVWPAGMVPAHVVLKSVALTLTLVGYQLLSVCPPGVWPAAGTQTRVNLLPVVPGGKAMLLEAAAAPGLAAAAGLLDFSLEPEAAALDKMVPGFNAYDSKDQWSSWL
mmetsp:Transcript_46238/g.110005  ORF Transcript_46238/g.110005 Transcript_46238/m.110005 type:complete len:184 (-) Transcript_46238:1011-1562(-)